VVVEEQQQHHTTTTNNLTEDKTKQKKPPKYLNKPENEERSRALCTKFKFDNFGMFGFFFCLSFVRSEARARVKEEEEKKTRGHYQMQMSRVCVVLCGVCLPKAERIRGWW
jgi:fatty acid desaturase